MKDYVFNLVRGELRKEGMQMNNLYGRLYSGVDEGLSAESSPVGVDKLWVTLGIYGISWDNIICIQYNDNFCMGSEDEIENDVV